MARRRNVVRLGVPALIVAGLAIVALWRVSAPSGDAAINADRSTAPASPVSRAPLTAIADLLVANAAGRQASLESVRVDTITSPRTFWIGSGSERAFVVLDPNVKRAPDTPIAPDARVTLIGMVRPAPAAAQAIKQWAIDGATAQALLERGTYLHAIEIRP